MAFSRPLSELGFGFIVKLTKTLIHNLQKPSTKRENKCKIIIQSFIGTETHAKLQLSLELEHRSFIM